MNDTKIFRIKFKIWVFIFLIYSAILVIFQIGCLATPKWIRQETPTIFSDVEWQGGILKVTDGDVLFDEDPYEELADDYCDQKDDLEDRNDKRDEIWALCDMFTALHFAGTWFVILEVFSMLMVIMMIGVMVLALLKRIFLQFGLGAAIAAPILHLAAFIGHTVSAKLNFDGDCDEIVDGDEQAKVCGIDGAGLSLAIIIFITIWGILYCVFCYSAWPHAKSSTDKGGRITDRPT